MEEIFFCMHKGRVPPSGPLGSTNIPGNGVPGCPIKEMHFAGGGARPGRRLLHDQETILKKRGIFLHVLQKGPVPPSGPSGCTNIPGSGGSGCPIKEILCRWWWSQPMNLFGVATNQK
ncbi:Uncharacterized protein Fot_22941 [Forsythia ovata]|uniref:Uncharacterized protein n=1 Tax=Forsythia ovata TaxID=205694 RepID=A0ABD1UZ50_9LAMI